MKFKSISWIYNALMSFMYRTHTKRKQRTMEWIIKIEQLNCNEFRIWLPLNWRISQLPTGVSLAKQILGP